MSYGGDRNGPKVGKKPRSADSHLGAPAVAEPRALRSYFDQHIVEEDGLGYFALGTGDYNALPTHLAHRLVHTVHGGMLDEF